MRKNQSIKKWYLENYPDDEMGQEIKEHITFYGLFETLDNYKSVYNFLGVYDSLIRERVFEQLAKIMGVDYEYIYEQWAKCTE